MSDRIALLRSGELEQVASPREIYNRPATAYVAQFIGHTNLLKGEVRGGVAHCQSLSWPAALPNGPVLFSLRPEHLRLIGDASRSGSVRVRGRIVDRAFHGASEMMRVQSIDGPLFLVRTTGGSVVQNPVELEFSYSDAVPVRESPGKG
jgi:ABC-type Fe3+/spermidine/putrescine transport system ATPase subunit